MKFRDFPDWSTEVLKGIEKYLQRQAVSELTNSCSSISGGTGMLKISTPSPVIERPKTEEGAFSELSMEAQCHFEVSEEDVHRNFRTMYSLYRFRHWNEQTRLGFFEESDLPISTSSYWIKELSEATPLSSGSRAFLINLIRIAPLKSASRTAVLEALVPYFDSSTPIFGPLEDLLKQWQHEVAPWLEQKIVAKEVSAARAAHYLSAWGKDQVPLSLIEKLIFDPEAAEGAIGILDAYTFTGKEAHLFRAVLKACEGAVAQRFGSGTSMRVVGKFKNPEALKVLNKGLLVGGLGLSMGAQPEFVSATLDGIEPLIKTPNAKKALPNLKLVAERYFDKSVRQKAKQLLAKLRD